MVLIIYDYQFGNIRWSLFFFYLQLSQVASRIHFAASVSAVSLEAYFKVYLCPGACFRFVFETNTLRVVKQ